VELLLSHCLHRHLIIIHSIVALPVFASVSSSNPAVISNRSTYLFPCIQSNSTLLLLCIKSIKYKPKYYPRHLAHPHPVLVFFFLSFPTCFSSQLAYRAFYVIWRILVGKDEKNSKQIWKASYFMLIKPCTPPKNAFTPFNLCSCEPVNSSWDTCHYQHCMKHVIGNLS